MLKRIGVGISGIAFVCATAGLADARTASQGVEHRTTSAAHKTGEYLSDTEITTAVKTKLLADKKVSGLDIHVETDNAVVTLSGAVGTAAQRSHAAQIARNTHGVKRVIDQLTIEKTAERKSSSHESVVDKTEDKTEHVAKRTGEATKHGAEKSVDAVKGTSGTVAKDAEGVAKKTGRVLSDAEITTALKTKFAVESGVHSTDIHVDTDKGVVTLTGSVQSEAERSNAVRIAEKTMGVKRVIDKLTVK